MSKHIVNNKDNNDKRTNGIDKNNVAEMEQEKKGYVLSTSDIICYVCALILCLIPFTPFMSEMDMHVHIHDGEAVYETEIANFIYLNTSAHFGNFQEILMTIMAYAPIAVAVCVVVSTIIKNNILRYIMMVFDAVVAGYWVVAGNRIVAKIFSGDLYEPAAGYYMLLVASIVIIIVTLTAITKEKNPTEDNMAIENKTEVNKKK